MFAEANKVARQFTRPIVISQRTETGDCSSSIGACVVLNAEGWFITAYHIMDQVKTIEASNTAVSDTASKRAAIENDATLSRLERKNRLSKLPRVDPRRSVKDWSVLWGWPGWGVALDSGRAIPAIDIAIGRFDPFEPSQVQHFPKIKDPGKDCDPGTSLCRLGYPFHTIKPTYDDTAKAFILPNGSFPPTFFPIEGIYTRMIQVEPPNSPSSQPKYPLYFLETSSPGLRGQSGGPIFDKNGAVWAIQSRTQHFSLGFDPEVPNGRNQHEHQFLNVGWGIHTDTLCNFLREHGILFEVTDY